MFDRVQYLKKLLAVNVNLFTGCKSLTQSILNSKLRIQTFKTLTKILLQPCIILILPNP